MPKPLYWVLLSCACVHLLASIEPNQNPPKINNHTKGLLTIETIKLSGTVFIKIASTTIKAKSAIAT